MTRYERGWASAAAITATLGVWAALATWPWFDVLVVSAFAGATAASGAAAWHDQAPNSIGRVLRAGAAGGLVPAGVAGLTVMLDATGALLSALVGLTAPPTLRLLRRTFTILRNGACGPVRAKTSAGAGRQRAGDGADCEDLDDASLCQAWRSSQARLEQASSPEETLREVRARQRYIDELERRHPDGLAAWLSTWPLSSSDPGPFLSGRTGGDEPSAA